MTTKADLLLHMMRSAVNAHYAGDVDASAATLAARFEVLDQHLQLGGQLPEAWKQEKPNG